MHYVGIDVSKASLEASDPAGERRRSFPNSRAGAVELIRWAKGWSGGEFRAVLEPTSVYHHTLWAELSAAGAGSCVINPAWTKSYSGFLGWRSKTDRADARLLALMGEREEPGPSPAPDERQERLKALRRHIEWLEREIQAARNRLHGANSSPLVPGSVERSLERVIGDLERARDEAEGELDGLIGEDEELSSCSALLQTIPGIGPKTAALVLAEMPSANSCSSSRAWVAFAGLCPREVQSGTSGYSVLSRRGSARVRSGLYLPGVVALSRNPAVKAMRERMEARGKTGKLAVVAAMSKLLRICYGVLKSRRPYDPQEHLKHARP